MMDSRVGMAKKRALETPSWDSSCQKFSRWPSRLPMAKISRKVQAGEIHSTLWHGRGRGSGRQECPGTSRSVYPSFLFLSDWMVEARRRASKWGRPCPGGQKRAAHKKLPSGSPRKTRRELHIPGESALFSRGTGRRHPSGPAQKGKIRPCSCCRTAQSFPERWP